MRVLVTVGASHAELARISCGAAAARPRCAPESLGWGGFADGDAGRCAAAPEPTPPSPAGIDADFAESVAQFHEFA